MDLPSKLWTGTVFPKFSTAVDTGHNNNTSDLLYHCLIEQTLIHRILSRLLSKQLSKHISTFKLNFCLLHHLLLKPKTLQVLQVQHLLQGKGVMYSMTYLVFWLLDLSDLLSIHLLPWPTQPTNFLSMIQSPFAKANSRYFCLSMRCTPQEIEHNEVVVKKEKRGEEGSKQFTLNNTAATKALKPGFGAAKHFVKRSKYD